MTTQYLSITELNQRVSALLERQIPLLWVQGEISNLTRAASGHWYFSLKDDRAQVRAVMFRHKNALLSWQPREGDAVQAQVLTGLYAARGDFQLTVETMRPAGLGTLYERFIKLKDELARKGWFDVEYKQDMPNFVRRIGIITSPQAAALRDVVHTLARRSPHIEVFLYPTPVQGDAAPMQIAAAIQKANQNKSLDALLIVRGGGSLEDLWAFNETIVAQAIHESHLPTISGVGHETDTTIADFVADIRAATPTAAAELISSPSQSDHLSNISHSFEQLQRDLMRQLAQQAQRLDRLTLQLLTPTQRIAQQKQLIQNHLTRLQHALNIRRAQQQHRLERSTQNLNNHRPNLSTPRNKLNRLTEHLQRGITHNLQQHSQNLSRHTSSLTQLNPDNVLARGFAYVQTQDGHIINDAACLQAGDGIDIQFHKGHAVATVGHVGE
ncbi:Exodeoxyribonuclease 7 large subunit [Ephemeroptericola cinctiostellae]|uniref:Exodeoxyribonuclease 7 large subunit n=1 Tax=Ephemeroptericola cinctiostellae TaxID=2268024 RepID=A0A345DAT6_9BURK|nr:exodeoxyribonuclease VII large subunit [Ephemeroptericola cinctiostellae]AXF85474.1 Exodeoxyribonuclease 7 large subunit [Ephemeroptericola cinctiostellae]